MYRQHRHGNCSNSLIPRPRRTHPGRQTRPSPKPDKLHDEMLDLQHAAVHLAFVDCAITAGSDLCIVTARAHQIASESRLNLLQRNLTLFIAIIPPLASFWGVNEHSNPMFKPQTQAKFIEDEAVLSSSILRPRASSDTNREALMHGQSSRVRAPRGSTFASDWKRDYIPCSYCPTRGSDYKENRRGDQCFSAELLGPDGVNRHLGKWCKRVLNKGSVASSMPKQGSSTGTGDLIVVGADGRGGRIKNGEGSSVWPKRCKYGIKPSGQQSQGCLQIAFLWKRK
ncbi:hypothetical protein HHK36_018477 [Tetracentron sinense]|uniref:Uncharacterized protein n=1 Tax=Tetracentron sinense TaxID=13715 RepID=A0A835DDK6_TETSI|nr:hypothetical protein HHK36_018477 [Tetracentron sinense]